VRSSRDVYAYIMYGRIVAQHHESPYTHVPAEFPNDPALQRVQAAFRDTGSVYGPVFTGVSAAGMGLCGSSPLCGRLYFQSLEAIAVLGCAWLVLRTTRSWAAAVCVGFNPVLIASIVNGGHNDGLVALGVLGAVLIARARPSLAGFILGAAALVKVNALLPAAVLVAWLFWRDEKRKGLIAGTTTGLLVIVGYAVVGGTAALKPLHNTAEFVSFHSFWYPVERLVARTFDLHGAYQSRFAFVGLVIVIVIALMVAAGRARFNGPVPVVAVALSVYVLASPYILPWYTAPVIPLLALRHRARTSWLILSYAMLLYLLYPQRFPTHHTFVALILPEGARNVVPVVQVLMLLMIAFDAWRSRDDVGEPGNSARDAVGVSQN
jgi:hypothetical protein